MGYTLPGWADEALDVIGINFPNVDEDAYREMADALREFAEDFDDHGAEAHRAINRLLSSGEGAAADALEAHWKKVKGTHIQDVVDVSRTFATAMDRVADLIEAMKRKAEVELAALAASVGISIVGAIFTGGLSALAGAAGTAAAREAIRRAIKEAAEAIVEELVSKLTEPVVAKLEDKAADLLADLTLDALGVPDGGGKSSGPGGMQLNSVHGGSSFPSGAGKTGKVHVDHDEHDTAVTALKGLGGRMDTGALAKLGNADTSHGRARGKDTFTAPFDPLIDSGVKAAKKAGPAIRDHLQDSITRAIRHNSDNHKRNEQGLTDDLKAIAGKTDDKNPNSPKGTTPTSVPGRSHPERRGQSPSPELSAKGRGAGDKCLGGDPIDMATGEVFQSQTDLALPGILPLVVERTHISSYRHGQFFGPSWASTLDERLELVDGPGELWWHRRDGSSLRYPYAPDLIGEQVQPREGHRIPLTCVQGTSGWDLAISDQRTGLTRRFLPREDAPADQAGVWWLSEIEDRNHNTIIIEREPDGTPVELLHSGGSQVTLATDDGLVKELILQTSDGPVRVLAYGYDDERGLTEVTNSSGIPLRFGYDAERRLTSWTDRNDSMFQYVYDEHGRVVRTVGPDGCLSSHLVYEPGTSDRNPVTRYTDSTGATTTYHLNHLGQVIAETNPLGHTTYTEWDRYDRVLSRTDPLGHTVRFTYDDDGDLVLVEHPDATRTTFEYNPRHQAVATTLADGSVWQQEYDTRGNLTARTAPDGATTRFSHDITGAVTTVTNALGAITTLTHDSAGLVLTHTDPLGVVSTCTRDAFGRPVAVTDATGATTQVEWSVEGKPLRRTAADGTTSTWKWDGEGNCLSTTNPNGGTSTFAYGHFDLLTERTAPDGAQYSFQYDTELRLTQVRAPGGLTWEYTYDAAGRLVSETDFDDRTLSYRYDEADRLITTTTPTGDTISFQRDAMGRTTLKDAAGTATSYRHDARGRLLQATSPDAQLALEYDPLGRILSDTVNGRTSRYTYDAIGRRTSRTTPTGAVTTLTYDQADRRASVSLDDHVLSFQRDVLGRELSRIFGDGVSVDSLWDPLGRLTRQSVTGAVDTLRDRSYSYRADSYPTSLVNERTGEVQSTELDSVGRPLVVTAVSWRESYAYDQNGNQTAADWPEPAGDPDARGSRSYAGTRIQRAGRVTYEYDAAGRTTVRRKSRISRKAAVWRYRYDAEDRMTSCVTPDGVEWRYTYDPLGRRIRKYCLADDGVTIAQETLFTWDGTLLVEQTDRQSGVSLTWEYDGRRPLAQYERKPLGQEEIDSRFFAIVSDLIGSPTELVESPEMSQPTLEAQRGAPRPGNVMPAPTRRCATPGSTPTRRQGSTTTSSGTTTPKRPAIPQPIRSDWTRPPTPSPTYVTPQYGATLSACLPAVGQDQKTMRAWPLTGQRNFRQRAMTFRSRTGRERRRSSAYTTPRPRSTRTASASTGTAACRRPGKGT